MDSERFNEIVKKQVDECLTMLSIKGSEYSVAVDRLHNFRVSAALEGTSMPEALAGMMAKHTVSIYDMIPKASGYSSRMWEEKITDHINYLLILKAILSEVSTEPGTPTYKDMQ